MNTHPEAFGFRPSTRGDLDWCAKFRFHTFVLYFLQNYLRRSTPSERLFEVGLPPIEGANAVILHFVYSVRCGPLGVIEQKED